MNYPVWDVRFGAGLLIAIVSILHVLVSHFAVGGGLFLVLTEHKALRQNDTGVLSWWRTRSWLWVGAAFGQFTTAFRCFRCCLAAYWPG
jgi:hypothetical protein